MDLSYNKLYEEYNLLVEENRRLENEIILLKKILSEEQGNTYSSSSFSLSNDIVSKHNDKFLNIYSSSEDKIELFKSLFRGREDVCAKRWRNKPGYSPYCFNDFKQGTCLKPKVKCSECKNNDFAPYDEERIKNHLLGKYVLGFYPMTLNDTCFILAMDFDESKWEEDISTMREICKKNNIPVYAERSRSGKGCHLWFFFEEETKASLARKFGTALLNLAMQESGNIKFNSYDRLFPSQDFLQKQGFGNLIALPLQKKAREGGNSVYIDESLKEIEDQWKYLSQIHKISEEEISRVCNIHKDTGRALEAEINEHKKATISVSKMDFPEIVILEKGRGIKVSKYGLSPKGLLLLRSLASYPNPEFYAKQAMRQSTYGTPRITVIYEEDEENFIIPRGIEAELLSILDTNNIKYIVNNNRYEGRPLKIEFCGELTDRQQEAFYTITQYNEGVLSATTGFGKTVIGARIIADKKCPTLILVHTKELASQWKERLEQFLQIDQITGKHKNKKSAIGQLGGGKKTLHGIVDIAIMQSMFERDKSVKQIINHYGLVIVDECHHISAKNFSRIIKAADAKYVYGLTATPIRKDGHHPIIFMHCGPIRYKVDPKKEAMRREFSHYIIPRFTNTRMPIFKKDDEWRITEVYQHICESKYRNELIVSDIEEAINAGRNPLVLTERTKHISELLDLMAEKDFEVIVLSGALKTKDRKEALEKTRALKDGDRFVILATGKLIGEGFDEARLDTLFIAMPIAWKGTIAQYAGRLHRSYEGKTEVLIYDYVDVHIPVLERMYHKRLSAYRSVGYSIRNENSEFTTENIIYDKENYFEHLIQDIKETEKNILISSPFLQKKKIDQIKEILIGKYKEGIRITLCVKTLEEYSDRYRNYISDFINHMQAQGINVIQIPNNYLKFTLIDNIVVWYGGVDILGGNYKDNSIIRIQNEALANELMGAIIQKP